MTAVSGILALLQILLFPALIACKTDLFRRSGLTEKLICMFPVGLIANYILVFVLTSLHIYRASVVLAFILLEITAIIYLYSDTLKKTLSRCAAEFFSVFREEAAPLTDFLNTPSLSGWIWLACGCFALSGVLWGFHLCRLNIGTIFSGWDTLFSWNTYAEIWASGEMPRVGGMYPQLVPANWSLSYLLQGENPVQFFNTLIPPVFFLLIQLMLFDLGFSKKEYGYFIAAVISRYMMKKLLGDGLFDGYMDVPAAAMVLLSVYCIVKAEGISAEHQSAAIFRAVVFASGAAVTKQSGIVALAAVPAAAYMVLGEGIRSMTKKQKLTAAVIAATIVLPWYLRCLYLNIFGAERTLIEQGILSYNSTFDPGFRIGLALETLGKYKFCFLFALFSIIFLVPLRYKPYLFILFIPQTAIWAFFFSYDARNIAAALPFVSISCGIGIEKLVRCAWKCFTKIKAGKTPLGIILLLLSAASVISLLMFLPDTLLVSHQKMMQRKLFGETLNSELILPFLGEEHSGFDIYTDYPAQFLPGYSECCTAARLTDVEDTRTALEGDKINWLLLPVIMPNNTDPAKELIEKCIEDEKCQKVGCSEGYYKAYCLYKIDRHQHNLQIENQNR